MNPHETASGLALADGNVAALAWRDAWRLQARNHPWMTGGLGLALAAMALLLGAGIRDGLSSGGEPLRLAVLGGLAGFAATAVGALAGVTLRQLSQRAEDSLLGFAAGMMLAASSFSLILPGLAAAKEMTGSGVLGALTVVGGMALGVLLIGVGLKGGGLDWALRALGIFVALLVTLPAASHLLARAALRERDRGPD